MPSQLPAEIESRLEALAKASGLTSASYAADVILEHIGDLEDLKIAEQRMDDLRAGRSTTVSLEDLIKAHGLEN